MLETIVRRTIRKTIEQTECDLELKRAFLRHTSMNGFVAHICKEINIANLRLSGKGLSVKKETAEQVTREFVETSIKRVQDAANERVKSDIEKYKQAHANDDEKDMQDALEGRSNGIFEDMGLEIPIEQQENQETPLNSPLKEGRVITYGKKESH